MAIYLEMPHLDSKFPFRTLLNEGDILTMPHWHNEIEIIYVKKGVIHMGIGEESIEAREGEFVLIASGRVHYVLASPGSTRYVYQLHENFFYDLIMEGTERNSLMILAMYRNKETKEYEEAEESVIESSYTLEKLDEIFQYVEEHYQEQITGFSPFYFTRFFKKNVGKTFLQFLNEYRIDKAKWILMNEDRSVNEIIEQTGIGSTKTYYRLFKEIVGMSPKEYKKKL